MSMNCNCFEMPSTLRGSTSDSPFKAMEEIDHKSAKWINLLRCKSCGQNWQVDGWDKYQVSLAIKISDPEGWSDFDDLPFRMDHLLVSRGGTSTNICTWQGCKEYCLKGLAYCVHHAYETGLRE